MCEYLDGVVTYMLVAIKEANVVVVGMINHVTQTVSVFAINCCL